MDVQEIISVEATQVKSSELILNSIGNGNYYVFHRQEVDDEHKKGYRKYRASSISKGLHDNHKAIYKWQKFYDKIINQRYELADDITTTNVLVSTKSPKWMQKLMSDMKNCNNFMYIYDIHFKYNNCNVRINNECYQIETTLETKGLAFLDSYDSIRVIRDLSVMFSNVRNKIKENSDKVVDVLSGKYGDISKHYYYIDHGILNIQGEFIKNILG